MQEVQELQKILIDMMLSEESPPTYQQRFLDFLIMERFIEKFRQKGFNNIEIMALCQKLDLRNYNE